MSDETRKAVLSAAEKMGFIRDANAARLRSGRSFLLGAVIHDVSNPFFGELLSDFEAAAYEMGYLTIVANSKDDLGRQGKLLHSLASQGIAGLLVSPAQGTTAADFSTLTKRGTPLAICVRDVGDPAHDYVGINDRRAGYLAAARLLNAGAGQIAFIGGLDHTETWRNRRQGLIQALHEKGLRTDARLIRPGPPTREFGVKAMIEVCQNNPACRAIMCFNDYVAIGVYIAAARQGLDVGRDVAVVGIDNVPVAESLHPGLTTVEVFPRRAGRICADTLHRRLNRDTSVPARTLIEPELVERASVRRGS